MTESAEAKPALSRRALFQTGAFVAVGAGIFLGGAINPTIASAAATTTYYVAADGDDNASGTSAQTPWRTLAKVSATTLGPGTAVLFRAGDTFTGVLNLRGSGTASAPITIGKYGQGARPVLHGAGAVPATIHITETSHLLINELEITNTAASRAYRSGILITAPAAGLANISLRKLTIRDITGDPYTGQGNFPAAACGGIGVTSAGEKVVDGLLIQDVTITNVDDHGIRTTATTQTARGTNYVFRYVDVVNAGGNGIVMANVTGALVEGSTVRDSGGRSIACAGIWPVYSENVVIQNNGVWNQDTLLSDGFSYNCDWQNTNAIFQYNYSNGSKKGFFQSFFQSTAVVRYNVSQDDYSGFALYGASGIHIYNNTVYLKNGTDGQVMRSFNDQGRTPSNNRLTNNIIVNRGSGGFTSPGVSYDYNLFAGNQGSGEPTGNGNFRGDPQLVAPGTDATWAATGYRLRAGSPAIAAGTPITNNGGLDYFTQVVPAGAPNVGAHAGAGV
ncbi:right-handed parallel beta-helix repeat-containing protein [Microbacterium sp. GXF6406]